MKDNLDFSGLDICPASGKRMLTYEQAASVVRRMKFGGRARHRGKVAVRPYRCPDCRSWHVTSQDYDADRRRTNNPKRKIDAKSRPMRLSREFRGK